LEGKGEGVFLKRGNEINITEREGKGHEGAVFLRSRKGKGKGRDTGPEKKKCSPEPSTCGGHTGRTCAAKGQLRGKRGGNKSRSLKEKER